MDLVRDQYERFPYPPVSPFALPRKDQGTLLQYEYGSRLAHSEVRSHEGIRILVAGAGTLEALVVAQAHPHAKEVVAVDFSRRSVSILLRRVRFARAADRVLKPLRYFTGMRKLSPLKLVCADLRQWQGGSFDYVIASNVLHHVEDPAALLKRLSGWLLPEGIMRVVTYPRASRIWMRQASRYLKHCHLAPEQLFLIREARRAIGILPSDHPIRSCFESQPETGTPQGLTDAFFNPCENPLSPLDWERACRDSGLSLVGESQTETSRSRFLDEITEDRTRTLSAWEKLQVLDDMLELCANPVLWLRKESHTGNEQDPNAHGAPDIHAGPSQSRIPETQPNPSLNPFLVLDQNFTPGALLEEIEKARLAGQDQLEALMPSKCYWELAQGLRRSARILKKSGLELQDVLNALKREVGPRVRPEDPSLPLPGLSVLEHDLSQALRISEPWNRSQWERAQANLPAQVRLKMAHAGLPLTEQAEWLQLRFGSIQAWISVVFSW